MTGIYRQTRTILAMFRRYILPIKGPLGTEAHVAILLTLTNGS